LDDWSDQHIATFAAANNSDSDCDSPIPLLRRRAQEAKFTFTSPISVASSSPFPCLPAHVIGTKRPKGHPDAPTPNLSLQKSHIFKQQADDVVAAPVQPLFVAHSSTSAPGPTVDVFGPVTRHQEQDGYGSDSEVGSGSECSGCGSGDNDDYSWGLEDNALVPLESQSQMTVCAFHNSFVP
jgi:hypothetical protein